MSNHRRSNREEKGQFRQEITVLYCLDLNYLPRSYNVVTIDSHQLYTASVNRSFFMIYQRAITVVNVLLDVLQPIDFSVHLPFLLRFSSHVSEA